MNLPNKAGNLAIILALTCGGLALMAGCERRNPALDVITSNASKLRTVATPDAKTQEHYSAVIHGVAPVGKDGGKTGAAAYALTAASQIGLADPSLTQYAELETQSLGMVDTVQLTLSYWIRKNAAASGSDQFSVATELERIGTARTSYQNKLNEARTQKERTDQQIGALSAQAKGKLESSQGKLLDFAKRMDEASRLAPTQAAAATEDAHALKRQAESERREGLEIQARADLLEPVSAEWALKAAQFENQLANLAQSEKDLQDQDALVKKSAGDARADARTAGELLTNQMRQLAELRSGALAESADKAGKALKAAADAGNPAKEGSPAQSALMIALARQAQGELQWSRASGHASYASLLKCLATVTPGLPAKADYESASQAIDKARQDAETQAKDFFKQAKDAFERAANQGAGGAKEHLKALAARYAALSGQAADAATDSAAAAKKPEPAREPAPAAAKPAYDPALKTALEQYIAAGKSLDGAKLTSMFHSDNAQVRDMMASTSGMLDGFSKLERAMKDKFKKGFVETLAQSPAGAMMGGAGGGLGQFEAFEKLTADQCQVSQEGDSATVTADGLKTPIHWKKVGGAWKVVSPEMETMLANPQVAAQMGMAKKLYPAMGKLMEELAGDVKAGKLTDPNAVLQAFQAKLMPMMQEMMGPGAKGPK